MRARAHRQGIRKGLPTHDPLAFILAARDDLASLPIPHPTSLGPADFPVLWNLAPEQLGWLGDASSL
jgi:hypothetical protein